MGIVVVDHVTLNGVMQGPGRPDEDLRGGGGSRSVDGPRHGPVVLVPVRSSDVRRHGRSREHRGRILQDRRQLRSQVRCSTWNEHSLLLPVRLVDSPMLIVRPIVLGTGQSLFPDAERFDLRLEGLSAADGGLVLAQHHC